MKLVHVKKHSFFFVAILSIQIMHAQDILCGRVVDDQTGDPVQAKVYVGNSKTFTQADQLGNFCVTLDSTQVVYFFDPYYSLYKLNVHEEYTTIRLSKQKRANPEYKSSSGWMYTDRTSPISGFSPSFSVSYFHVDYAQFDPVLDSSLISALQIDYTVKFELAGYIQRFYLGLGYGILPYRPQDKKVQSTTGHFSANIGYNLINKGVILTPTVGYFSYRNRVKSENENDDLNDYLSNRGYDLKFNGQFLRTGLDVVVGESFDHYLIGIRASYLHQLGGTLVKNGFGDQLATTEEINFGKFNVELVFTIFTN